MWLYVWLALGSRGDYGRVLSLVVGSRLVSRFRACCNSVGFLGMSEF